MHKKVLVTGGAGFLGSHLCDALVKRGDTVTCIDNLSTGKISNISHLEKKPEFSLILQDVENSYDITSDIVFNLACPASPIAYQKNHISNP